MRDKQDRQEDLPLKTAKHFVRYGLPTKLSHCNDNASPSGIRLRNRVRLCQDWQLVCLSFYFRVSGYPTVTGIGYPVPKISVNARPSIDVTKVISDVLIFFSLEIHDLATNKTSTFNDVRITVCQLME